LGRKSTKQDKELLSIQDNPLANNVEIIVDAKPIRNAVDENGNPVSILIERINAIKLFKSLKTKHLILYNIQKPNTHRLLFLILFNIQKNDDFIRLNNKLLCKALNLSRNTINQSIKELEQLNIIQKTNTKDYYWINPEILFYGSRKNKYPDKCQ